MIGDHRLIVSELVTTRPTGVMLSCLLTDHDLRREYSTPHSAFGDKLVVQNSFTKSSSGELCAVTSVQGALIAWRLTFTTLGSNEGRQAMDPTTVLVSREVILAAGCGQAINDHLSCLLDTCSAASALMKVMMHRSSRKRVAVCMRDACRCVLAVPLAACSPATGPLQARGICPRLASHVSAFPVITCVGITQRPISIQSSPEASRWRNLPLAS